MGNPFSSLSDIFEDAIAVLTVALSIAFPIEAIILATVCDSCEEFMSDQWEVVLGWLGITDQDIFSVQVQDQKLINDDTFYKNLMTQVALEHQATQLGIIELLAVKSQGIRGSLQRYSRYGEKEYIDGLPETSINTIVVDKDAIDSAITTERGFDIDVISIKTKVPKEDEWVYSTMTKLHGYIASTGVFNYLGDDYTLTSFYYDFTGGVYKVEGTLVASPFTVVTISIGNFIPNIGYVVHYLRTGTAEEFYWVYFIGSGNADLDNARNTISNLDMLPIVELRRGSVSIDSDKTAPRYTQSKEILGILGIDVDTMLDSLNTNPDISNVTAAYIYFGAELGSNNPLQAKLVYNILEYLWQDPTVVSGGSHNIRVTEGDYNSTISWEKQTREVVARSGVVIGKCEGGVGTETGVGGNKYYGWVRRQETADEYVEYRVYNASAFTVIMKTGFKDVSFRVLSPGELIVMPISKYFVSKFTPIEQAKLFPEILRLATYAANVQHLRYYQTEEFFTLIQVVIYVVAIVLFVLTIYAGGTGGAAFLAAAQALLIGMAVGYALQLLLSQIDNPYARAIAAGVIAGVMAYYGNAKGAQQMGIVVANVLSEMVSTYADAVLQTTEMRMADLMLKASTFESLMDARNKELEDKNKDMMSYLSTEDVLRISQMDPIKPYIEGPDLKIYSAVQIQYEWGLAKSMETHTQIYDYDMHYRIGVS